MALCQHLGSDEDAGFSAVDLFQDALDATFALCAIPVDTNDGSIRKAGGKYVFGLLCALANRLERLTFTFRAGFGRRSLVITVVASHRPVAAMVGKACVASRALNHMAAIKAHHDRRKAPAVYEHQCLAATFQGLPDRLQSGPRKPAFKRPAAYIQQADCRRQRLARTFFKPYELIFAAQSVVI